MPDLDSLQNDWRRPPALYRGAPFWSWNARLQPDRLQRQIQSMSDAKMGGFFMHSRYGLKTPYLSDEWFECVSACIDKARELRMNAYLYDEDRWPSGPAGGIVTRKYPECRLHYLAARFDTENLANDHFIALFQIHLDEHERLLSYDRIVSPTECEPGARILCFDMRRQQPTGWTNDGGYLDTMSLEAVYRFIRVTHEAYAERYADDMPDLIPAIFTDEPSFGAQIYRATSEEHRIPWTPGLPGHFLRRRGYDIRDHLPELILPRSNNEFSSVSYHYHRTITELFVRAFTAQIGEWCEQHDLALTGHMLAEQTLISQSTASAAAMPHYEHMQWPGIDLLTDQDEELATAKQCTSVAAQLDKERVLTELYGCTGWDWPLEGHKFIGDWQWACGVNFRCPHLTHYSLAGGAKRDYPASIMNHSPWWKYYDVVEDYFARLSLMLAAGKPVRDLLIIHPVESAWGYIPISQLGQQSPADELQDQLKSIIYTLSNQHYDWDFADESLLARYGSVSADSLKVGQMDYQLVIVPPAATIRSSTLQLLRQFIEAGGHVLFVGSNPHRMDAEKSDDVNKLRSRAHTCPADPAQLVSTLENLLPRKVSLTEDGDELDCLWSLFIEVDDGHVLFIQSHDRENSHTVNVNVSASGPVVQWDPMRGHQHHIDAQSANDRSEFELQLQPTGSALLSIGLNVPEATHPPPETEVTDVQKLEGPFDVQLTEPNTFPLDYCQYRIKDEEFSDPVPVLKADERIRATYGLDTRLGREHQPWYLYATGVVDTKPRDRCQLRWTFHITDLPDDCRLALESPDDFRIAVNETHVTDVDGFWVDEDIETMQVAHALQTGDNQITLTFDYRPDMELEPMYLVGNFGVRSRDGEDPAPDNMTITEPPSQLPLGSWVGNGLDFYSAGVLYKTTLNKPANGTRCHLSLPGIKCTAAAIHVGDETFVLPWKPFAADITDAMSEAENEVLIEVIGGRKNILGPLHTPWERGTGPFSFDPNHDRWRHQYYLTDHGLTDPILVEILQTQKR